MVERMKLISIKEKMPQDNDVVLLYADNGGFYIGYVEDGTWWGIGADYFMFQDDYITQWCELPLIPEVEVKK